MFGEKKEKIIIFGASGAAEKIESEYKLHELCDIIAYVDNDSNKQGMLFNQVQVISPNQIKNYIYDRILICSMYWKEIREQLICDYSISSEKIITYHEIYDELLEEVRKKLMKYSCNDGLGNEELLDIYNYLKNNEVRIFNYDFCKKYDQMKKEVYFDNDVNMYYLIHNEKKMYFAKNFTKEKDVLEYYKGLCIEQDIKSPHRYLIDDIQVKEGDIVIDAGVAEANFALDIVDKVSKMYLIESDPRWIEALKQTFKEYKDKVIIVDKFLTYYDDENNVTIDTLLNGEEVNFIKMDIEGAEIDALNGGKITLTKSKNINVSICSYHRETDEEDIKNILKNYGFNVDTTKGYMFCTPGDIPLLLKVKDRRDSVLRRGIVRGRKY